MADANRPGEYVREVTDKTLAYLQELQREVGSLRARVSDLESEKAQLRSEVDLWNEEMTKQYAWIEEQNANLANLYVASYRLHETLERQELLGVIQEILSSLVGSEEGAIFALTPSGEALEPLCLFGLEPERFQSLPAGAGIIGQAMKTGSIFIAGDQAAEGALAHERDLTACIPLRLGDTVMGAIAVFRLLRQKKGITRVDRELFELLATHAATALYSTELHARMRAGS
jgi:GAF domain-containing protein